MSTATQSYPAWPMISATDGCGSCIQLPMETPPSVSVRRIWSIFDFLFIIQNLELKTRMLCLQIAIQRRAAQKKFHAIFASRIEVRSRVADYQGVLQPVPRPMQHLANRT